MFTDNGINVSYEELKKIFNIVDEDGSGSLSLKEFETYVVDKEAQEKFRQVIKEVR